MGYWKYALFTTVTVFAFTSFVACDQNKNQQIKAGAVVSDGTNVSMQSSLGNYPLNVAVTNIGAGAGSGSNTYTYNYGGAMANPAHFDILITSGQSYYGYGMANTATSNTVNPTIYDPMYAQWYGSYSQIDNMYPISTASGFSYKYEGKCSNQACDILYLNIVVIAYNDVKQIGIKKSLSMNKVLGVAEFSGNIQNIMTTDQLIQEINKKSSL